MSFWTCFLVAFFFVINLLSHAQDLEIFCDTSRLDFVQYKDSLSQFKMEFGKKHKLKTKDNKLQLAYYVALRHYPELHSEKITLKQKKINTTMQAQPKWHFIFKNKANREYTVIVNSSYKNGIHYSDLSFNSLVGWIGHEMAHICDYSVKDNPEMLGFIASYLFNREQKKQTERKADEETVRHGLGMALLDGVKFFNRKKGIPEAYRKRKKDFYLTKEEIIAEINAYCNEQSK